MTPQKRKEKESMRKIVFIGGGSSKFIREVAIDLFGFKSLQSSRITLMDIDAERVRRSQLLVQRIIGDLKLDATVEATTDQRQALEGADYVVTTIMVGGFDHYHSDVAIPERYGVTQAVSDTIGPGAVMRAVRTVPVLRKLAHDVKELCPHAWILNYANPMAMNTWTLLDCGHERTVGLCHSLQHTYRTLAGWAGVPHEQVQYTAAGINHINFYLRLEHNGKDLYPVLRQRADRIVAENPNERVRFELLDHLGYFPAEGPSHQTEYYPWFRKNEELVKHYAVETYWGYNLDSEGSRKRTEEVEQQIAGKLPIQYGQSLEYAARIIHSLEEGEPRVFYGNVRNRGLIENLPAEAVVEVPCLVDRNGIFPCRMGRIPPQLAAVMTPHIHIHEMAVNGALRRDRRLIEQAIQADPLTGAVLTLPRIREMTRELLKENASYTQDWH
jgi:alpha-galactosidase